MQMYRGLPVITNQMPVEERNAIPHHLMNCVDVDEEPWRVGIFQRECLRLIRDIHARGKRPILVGGTHYYTRAVLFKGQILGEDDDHQADSAAADSASGMASSAERWPILSASPQEMLCKLREVDPVMASRWHPNESRKIRRSLEVYLQTGRPASEIYAEQRRQQQQQQHDLLHSDETNAIAPTVGLRFPTLIFWVHYAEKAALNARLDRRVDAMVLDGLLSEALSMADHLRAKRSQGITVDQGKGVWVSIGFKELTPYLEAIQAAAPSSTTASSSSSSQGDLEKLKASCLESVKSATRQYAAYQTKYIKNTLWRALAQIHQTGQLYVLDGTDLAKWDENIKLPAERVVDSFLRGVPCPDPKSLSDLARTTLEEREAHQQSEMHTSPTDRSCLTCDVCQKTMTDEAQWNVHINGYAHKRVLKSRAKRAARDEYLHKRQQEEENASR